MKQQALGLIETVGYSTAVSAADAALKAADVTLVAIERVIGAGGALGVTIHLSGDVAAVTSAVQAGKEEAQRVGTVISSHVIPRVHNEVDEKILTRFLIHEIQGEPSQGAKPLMARDAGNSKRRSAAQKKKDREPIQTQENNQQAQDGKSHN